MPSDQAVDQDTLEHSIDWKRLTDMLTDSIREQASKLGKVNIVVAGRTGAGKSTLINAIFREDFAETAMGSPVTQTARWYEKERHPLRILDTKGLETSEYPATRQALKAEIAKGRSTPDWRQHIHIGWVCVQEPALRLEEAEQDLINLLKDEGIPTIVVLTKHGLFPEFYHTAAKLAARADEIVAVRALPMPGFPAVTGLTELVQATFHLIPDATRAAFAAAQAVDFGLKASVAQKIIAAASTAAGAAATIPLPFSDAITLVPIQVGMIIAISQQFGIETSKDSLLPVATSIIGCVAATLTGRIIVGQILKLLPGGGLINATVAVTLTSALGQAYLAFLQSFHSEAGRFPVPSEIADGFREYWKDWSNKDN